MVPSFLSRLWRAVPRANSSKNHIIPKLTPQSSLAVRQTQIEVCSSQIRSAKEAMDVLRSCYAYEIVPIAFDVLTPQEKYQILYYKWTVYKQFEIIASSAIGDLRVIEQIKVHRYRLEFLLESLNRRKVRNGQIANFISADRIFLLELGRVLELNLQLPSQ